MEIEFFLPQGPHPTEMDGLDEMRKALPRAWKGFANFIMRQRARRGQDREIDLVVICPDRIILADLKHIRGRIENRGGFWYREGESLGSSPAHKIRENAKMLASLIRSELNQLPVVPPTGATRLVERYQYLIAELSAKADGPRAVLWTRRGEDAHSALAKMDTALDIAIA